MPGSKRPKKVKEMKKDAIKYKLPEFDQRNSQVWFDITIGDPRQPGLDTHRVIMELFTKDLPKTAENFRSLCTGERGKELHYKGNIFHRVIEKFMA